MRIVDVPLGKRSYKIHIGYNLWHQLGAVLRQTLAPAKVLLVSDNNVFPLYGDKVTAALTEAGYSVTSAIVPAGEVSKSWAQAQRLYTMAIESGLDRTGLVVALGGGVVGDLAGFIAATYLRGVPLVQVPTSLLAQVDSSVGGKVAIDHPQGKNLIGTFYQPRLVWIDLAVLATLPQREFLAGAAEVVKYGAILSEPFFQTLETRWNDFLKHNLTVLTEVIANCCTLKAEIVRQDEREAGIRALLNFGHTIGHALETATGYTYFLHGEAVLAGMAMAVQLAVTASILELKAANRLLALFERVGLKKAPTGLTVEQITAAMQQDKKRAAGKVVFILPVQVGKGQTFNSITPSMLEKTIMNYLQQV